MSTKEQKHTPGPWKAWQPRGDESVPVRTDGLGITIAYVHQGAITDAQANARLIAAAPDMLGALKRIRAASTSIRDDIESETVAAIAEADAAIAKAEGR